MNAKYPNNATNIVSSSLSSVFLHHLGNMDQSIDFTESENVDDFYLLLNSTNATIINPPFFAFYLQTEIILTVILYPIISALILPMNIFAITVLSNKKMRSSTTIFLLTLSVSDMVRVFSIFMYFVCAIVKESSVFLKVYPYANYLVNATTTCSAWVTVAIGAERYISVCHANSAKQICTCKRAGIVSCVIPAIAFIFSLPYEDMLSFLNDGENSLENNMNKKAWKMFHFTYHSFRAVLPTCFLVCFSACILHRLRKSRLSQGRKRLTMTLLLVIFVFIICVLPDAILFIWNTFRPSDSNSEYLLMGIQKITDFLLLFSSGLNFLIYCMFNKTFAKSGKHVFAFFTKSDRRKGSLEPLLFLRRITQQSETNVF